MWGVGGGSDGHPPQLPCRSNYRAAEWHASRTGPGIHACSTHVGVRTEVLGGSNNVGGGGRL